MDQNFFSCNYRQSSKAAAAAAAAAAVREAAVVTNPSPQPEAFTTETPVEETNTTDSWAYDPNEPRYCICNEVSYGEMVGCDNDDVSPRQIEMFIICIW